MGICLLRVICFVLLGCLPAAALAATPLGGLAVALAPNGQVMAAAGDNRVLYVIDPVKMAVTDRVWLGTCILQLEFNKDGNMLVAEDTDGTLHLIDAKTWKPVKKEPKAEKMSPARQANLVAGLNPDAGGQTVRFLSLTDLAVKGKLQLAPGEKVAALGLDPQGARLAVWLEPVNDDSEPKEGSLPAGLKGLEAEEFRLKNDGKTSRLLVYKVPEGSKISEHKVFYSPAAGGAKILFQGDNVLVVNYSNINAQVNPKGEISLFQLDNSFNYGIGFAPDQKILLTGGLAEGTYTRVADLAKTKFQPDRLPGWPEYFKGFTTAADGTGYGSTSGFRLIRINPQGGVEKSFPVF